MCVLVRGKHAKDIVVFMHWFPEVTSFLFIPPVGVRVSKLTLLGRRIDVATVLSRVLMALMGCKHMLRRGNAPFQGLLRRLGRDIVFVLGQGGVGVLEHCTMVESW